MRAALALVLALVMLATPGTHSLAMPMAAGNVTLELVAGGLVDPIAVRAPDDGTGRLFVVEKPGRIRIVQQGMVLPEPFLDLVSTTVSASPEQGMYDIAFHPRFPENGLVYVSHTEAYLAGALVVWEYRVDRAAPNRADHASRRPVIAIQRRAYFHNGGTLGFGPDGYLYLGVGEGRPYQYSWAPVVNLAQSLENLDGKILRIDVDVPRPQEGAPANSYLVPANPFGGPIERPYAYRADMDMMRGDAFPEIWAYGLRNPWGFSFDPATGDLYIPDVGEFDVEEINRQPAASIGGENYGWDDMEGDQCRIPSCAAFVSPVHAYAHAENRCSVIGLAVSRSRALPHLDGWYLFADYCSGEVSGLKVTPTGTRVRPLLTFGSFVTERQVAGGGLDASGNVYLASCACGAGHRYVSPDDERRRTGAIWRIVPAGQEAPPDSMQAVLAPSSRPSPRWRAPERQ